MLSRCDAEDRVVGVGIANQRETAVVWERESVLPIGPAVSWQCRRTAAACAALRERFGEAIRTRTGLLADAYFRGPKIAWLLDSVPGARRRAEQGDLAAGTIDAWLLARLTAGAVHATEPTNVSRTMLWDIHRAGWDAELCAAQAVPEALLPEVRASAGEFGTTEAAVLGRALPVLAMAGDQQAALFGQGCVEAGSLKVTYGTGAFALMHTGGAAVGPAAGSSGGGLLTTRALSMPGQGARFALEGSVFSAGSLVDWLADLLGLMGGAAVSDLAAAAAGQRRRVGGAGAQWAGGAALAAGGADVAGGGVGGDRARGVGAGAA